MGEDMEKETYNLREFKRIFDIQNKSLANWLGFKVEESGVTLIPQYTLLTPMGDDLFNGEELHGRNEELRWRPLLELKKQTEMQKKRDRYTPKIPSPSERALELIKKRIKEGETEVIIPPSPHMEPDWERNPDLSKTLLTFPCSKEELISFIKITQLDDRIKSESDRKELLGQIGIEHMPSDKSAVRAESNKNYNEETEVPTGGRPAGSLREAVAYVYDKLKDNGNTELIKPGKIKLFLGYLKECLTEGNPNYSDYVCARIKQVKKVTTDCTIIMNQRTQKEIADFATTGINVTFKKQRVSAILTELREEN